MAFVDLIPEALRKRLWPDALGGHALKPRWMEVFDDMKDNYDRYYHYYSGAVLNEPADKKDKSKGLKYPLQLNISRMWCHMMSSYLWGEYDRNVVSFTVERRKQESGKVADLEEKRCVTMEQFLRDEWVRQRNNTKADAAAIDLMVYGGMVPKVYWSTEYGGICTDWLPPTIFAPRWHPFDVTRLIETYIIFEVSAKDARDIFHVDIGGMPDTVSYVERWTDDEQVLMIDDKELKQTERNPMGFIPHIYVPRLRGPDHYGYFGMSLIADVMGVQDEVNARAADIGDGVAYSSHPIRWVVNYTGKDDLEVGADSLWDLGMSLGGRTPAAGVLDTKTNYRESMDFVNRVESFGRQAAYLPPIAFGEDEGSQRSSLTLLVRYQPLTMEVKRERLHLADGMAVWAKRVLELGIKHKLIDMDLEHVESHTITPNFAPVLPRSVDDLVEQWNVRIAGGFGTPEEAYRDLGHPEPQDAAEKALEYLEDVARVENITKGVWNGNAGDTGGNATSANDVKAVDGNIQGRSASGNSSRKKSS